MDRNTLIALDFKPYFNIYWILNSGYLKEAAKEYNVKNVIANLTAGDVNARLLQLNEILDKQDSETGLIRLGYQTMSESSTFEEVCQVIVSKKEEHEAFQELCSQIDEWKNGILPRDKAQESLKNALIQVAKGVSLQAVINTLNRLKHCIESFPDHFTDEMKAKDIENDMRLIELFQALQVSPFIKLRDLVKQRRVIENLNEEFDKVETPDKEATIHDRINEINLLIDSDSKSIFNQGNRELKKAYQIAIRGQNPVLFDLIKQWRNERDYNFYGYESQSDVESMVKNALNGLAYSYHLQHLKAELESLRNEAIVPDVLPDKALEAGVPRLKWKGQKNQLYSVFRQLKDADLITNSYEELAWFIHHHVEQFQQNAISTIVKEISRPGQPAKNKRINLEL